MHKQREIGGLGQRGRGKIPLLRGLGFQFRKCLQRHEVMGDHQAKRPGFSGKVASKTNEARITAADDLFRIYARRHAVSCVIEANPRAGHVSLVGGRCLIPAATRHDGIDLLLNEGQHRQWLYRA